MYVCNCNGLRERDAKCAIEGGAQSPQHVHRVCGVKTQCGLCYDQLRQMIQESAKASAYSGEFAYEGR